MSMHEIEDLVEQTIRFVDASCQEALSDKRSIIASLYEYQAQFDASDTLFRVIDILIKRHYIYVLSITDHPDYAKYRDYFDGLEGHTHILRNPLEKWSKQNPESGAEYFNPSKEWGDEFAHGQTGFHMYVTAGSEAWKRLVDNKTLTGTDSEAPRELDIFDLGYDIIDAAIKDGDKILAATWYKLGLFYAILPGDFDQIQNDPKLLKIRELAEAHDLINIETYDDDRVREMIEETDDKVSSWWFFKA